MNVKSPLAHPGREWLSKAHVRKGIVSQQRLQVFFLLRSSNLSRWRRSTSVARASWRRNGAMDKVTAIPHCSHWGAYRVVLRDGVIAGVEPHPQDPAPSPIMKSITDWLDPERRILQPMVRESWLEAHRAGRLPDGRGRGRDRFLPLSWAEAVRLVAGEIERVRQEHGNASIFAGSYGWTSCGRFHHAPTLLKRMLNLVG